MRAAFTFDLDKVKEYNEWRHLSDCLQEFKNRKADEEHERKERLAAVEAAETMGEL